MRNALSFRLSQSIVLCSLVFLFVCSLSVSAGSPQKRTWALLADPSLPVTVTEVRNLQSDHWLRDLEIKVRNDTGRPIYYLNLAVVLPDLPKPMSDRLRSGWGNWIYNKFGERFYFHLMFGSHDFLHKKYTRRGDPFLKPGESHIFRVPEAVWRAYENYLSENSRSTATAKNVLLAVRFVGFGNVSGYEQGEYFSPPQ